MNGIGFQRFSRAVQTLAGPRPLLKALVGLLLLLACVFAIPRAIAASPALYLAAGALGVVGVLILFRWPQLSLIALLAGGLLVPVALPLKMNLAVVFGLLAIGLWLIDTVIVQRKSILPAPPLSYAWLGFLGAVLLSLLDGQVRWFSLGNPAPLSGQARQMIIFLTSLGLLLAVPGLLKNIRWLKALTYTFLLIATTVYLLLDSLYVLKVRIPGMGNYIPNLNDAGAAGSLLWLFAICFAINFALFHRDTPLVWRIVLLAGAGLRLYISLTSSFDWKSGWLPAFVGLGVLFFLQLKKFRIPILAAAILVAALLNQQIIQVLQEGDSYSIYTRLAAWQTLMNVIRANPILGVGPANYAYYTTLFPILGYSVKFNSHNQFVDLIAQCGIVGLGTYLWLVFELFRMGWSRLKEGLGSFETVYVTTVLAGLVASLVAGMLGDWILPFVYNVGLDGMRASLLFWIFCGGLILIKPRQPS